MTSFRDICETVRATPRERVILRSISVGREARVPASREELLRLMTKLMLYRTAQAQDVSYDQVVEGYRVAAREVGHKVYV